MQYKPILCLIRFLSINITEYLILPPGAKETDESTKPKWKQFSGNTVKMCLEKLDS